MIRSRKFIFGWIFLGRSFFRWAKKCQNPFFYSRCDFVWSALPLFCALFLGASFQNIIKKSEQWFIEKTRKTPHNSREGETFFFLLHNPSLNQQKNGNGAKEDGQQIIEKINRMMTAKKVFFLSLEEKKLKSVFFFLWSNSKKHQGWKQKSSFGLSTSLPHRKKSLILIKEKTIPIFNLLCVSSNFLQTKNWTDLE